MKPSRSRIPLRTRLHASLDAILAAPALMLMLAINGCSDSAPPPLAITSTASSIAAAAHTSAAPPAPAAIEAAGLGRFADLVGTLSEPDGEFLSDNVISNETSYLQVAERLAERPAGGVYLGVGPEQNFSYIALARPEVAFLVDIRRGNMLQHLLYRALFDEAATRSHFLALLVGRPYDAASAPGPDADIDAVIAHAERSPADEKTFAATFDRLLARIERGYGVPLDANDKKTMEIAARSFLDRQIDVRFELHEPSGRRYPSLRELLRQGDPNGTRRGFLASEAAFRFVQQMQREGRVIPVVGDFAGDRAMPGIASLLRAHGRSVSTFYVSNVEQYLLEPKVWPKWSRNVAALPIDDGSLFVRAYLDQGRKHPRQMKGHRTTTLLQRIADFNAHQEKAPYRTFWALAADSALDARSASM